MSVYFADTSALAKRYIPENGSSWVLSWILPNSGNVTIISELSAVEIVSLLARRQREGSLSTANMSVLAGNFQVHMMHEYLVVPLESAIITNARHLVLQYPLRALDAIQLACAKHIAHLLPTQLSFISADQRLLSAARLEGFPSDNPNNYP